MIRLLVAVVLTAACGGRAPTPIQPPDHGHTGSAGSAESTGSAASTPGDTQPTEAACTAMIDHMIELDVAERPVDERPARDDLEKVRGGLRAQLLPGCLTLTRDQVACITQSATKAAVQTCAPPSP